MKAAAGLVLLTLAGCASVVHPRSTSQVVLGENGSPIWAYPDERHKYVCQKPSKLLCTQAMASRVRPMLCHCSRALEPLIQAP